MILKKDFQFRAPRTSKYEYNYYFSAHSYSPNIQYIGANRYYENGSVYILDCGAIFSTAVALILLCKMRWAKLCKEAKINLLLYFTCDAFTTYIYLQI